MPGAPRRAAPQTVADAPWATAPRTRWPRPRDRRPTVPSPSIRGMGPGDSPQRAVLVRRSFELPVVGELFPFHPGWPGRESYRPESVQTRLPLPHAHRREPLLEGRDPHVAQEEASEIRIDEGVAPHGRSIREDLHEARLCEAAEDPVHLRRVRPRRLRELVSGLRDRSVREQAEDSRPRFSTKETTERRLEDRGHR